MSSKKFTEYEINLLKANPYVLQADRNFVHFSAKFKELFWKALQKGNQPRDILKKLGIDPEILGPNRVGGLKTMVRNEVKAGKGFRDLATYGTYLVEYVDKEEKIKFLEQQLAFKNQEIAFLKKIVSLSQGDLKR